MPIGGTHPGAGSKMSSKLFEPRYSQRPARSRQALEDERALLAAARAGDTRALERLMGDLAGPLQRYGLGFCRNTADAEDLAQDVMVTLLRVLPRLRGDSALSTWAYVVAKRACIRRRRRESRMAPLDEGDDAVSRRADPRPLPPQRAERRELAGLLQRGIAALPTEQREAVVLRDVEGLAVEEAAKVTGLGVRAFKSRLHRGRLALRKWMAPYLANGESPGRPGCPDTARALSRALEGEIDPGTCARLESHVAGCPHCDATCRTLREVLGACRSWGAGPLPRLFRTRLRHAIRRAVTQHGVDDARPARRPARTARARA